MKPGTRVRHIVTRTEGVAIDTFIAARMCGLERVEYVRVKLPNMQQREWRIDRVEEVRP